MLTLRFLRLTIVAAIAVVGFTAQPVAAASMRTECGVFEYTAPDATTDGHIAFGAISMIGLTGTPYVIGAGSSVPENLSSLVGAPTCLRITVDGGVITHIEYAPSGTVKGRVKVYGDLETDPNAVYLTAGRVWSPAFVVDPEPGLWAILHNALTTGKKAKLVFQVHPEFGYPQAFTASVGWRGLVEMSDADVAVGLGVLPEELIDSETRTNLQQAANLGVRAHVKVTSVGTIDTSTGVTSVTSQVEVTFDADPVTGEVEGPCGRHMYYGVFDNSSGSQAVRFRMSWVTNNGSHVTTRVVPAGSVFRTWEHWAKPGTFVRVAYRNADSGRWVALDSEKAAKGTFPACSYTRGFTFPI